jgi:hypothetical protein
MANACRVAARLRNSAKHYKQFVKHDFWADRSVKPHRERAKNAKGLIYYVIDFVTQPGLENSKLAWKRGRVLEFLLEAGIAPRDIASGIRDAGGIEKLCKLAAAEDPRRGIPKSGAEARKADAKGETASEDSSSGTLDDNDRGEDADGSSVSVKTLLVLADAKMSRKAEKIGEGQAWVKIRGLGEGLKFEALKLVRGSRRARH